MVLALLNKNIYSKMLLFNKYSLGMLLPWPSCLPSSLVVSLITSDPVEDYGSTRALAIPLIFQTEDLWV